MPKRLTVKAHLTLEELERCYRQARDGVELTRYQTIWLLAQGKQTKDIAAVVGYTPNSIRRLTRQYNQHGPEVLRNRRRNQPGAPTLLTKGQQTQLAQALQKPAPDGEAWNSRRVAEWMSELLKRPVAVQRGWEYLRLLQKSIEVAQPCHKTEA